MPRPKRIPSCFECRSLGGQPCAKHAARAGAEAPDLGADQGLRLVDSREKASHNATGGFAGWSGGQPGDCHLSLQGSNSSPLKHHGVVTKTPQENIFCNQNGQQIKLNGARLPR